MILLDGRALAAQRASLLAARADHVRAGRGRAPCLLLIAFADDDGRVAHIHGKQRACAQAGVEVVCLSFAPTADTEAVLRGLQTHIEAHDPDGVFVQIPYPAGFDGAAIDAAIPVAADVDIMTPARYDTYMSGAQDTPPLTIFAALSLFDAHDVVLAGRRAVVVGAPHPFNVMFGEALRRRGAATVALIPAAGANEDARVRAADLVVVSVGSPGAVAASALAPGAVAADIGYFNEGGRGDIDVTTGVDHLGALMPVPGGVGPMTVSALVERVVQFAEERLPS